MTFFIIICLWFWYMTCVTKKKISLEVNYWQILAVVVLPFLYLLLNKCFSLPCSWKIQYIFGYVYIYTHICSICVYNFFFNKSGLHFALWAFLLCLIWLWTGDTNIISSLNLTAYVHTIVSCCLFTLYCLDLVPELMIAGLFTDMP